MNIILLLSLSVLLAFLLSFYQYYYKAKTKSKTILILFLLRFTSILGLLLLVINPIITRKFYEITKTPLPVVIDNSSSIVDLKAKQITLNLYDKLSKNKALKDKFDLQFYQFDSELETINKLDFKGMQTNLDIVANGLKSIYKNQYFPTILISDGNQTSGSDFVYEFNNYNKVYPIIVGDTTTIFDLKINQINANKYAFTKNKFPVEVFLQHSGNKNFTANFKISQGNTILNSQIIKFSPSKKSIILNLLLSAKKAGKQIFKATISTSETEKNSYNNSKNFAVEIIDQHSNVALIAAINHPDIGAIKRSIETNQQRKVTILKPNEIKSLKDFKLLILYQPTAIFKTVFESNIAAQKNLFIITGTATDFNFLNQQQSSFNFKMNGQIEDYQAIFNSQFNLFAIENIGFENFSPLQNLYGTITTKDNSTILLTSKIRGIITSSPLLTFSEDNLKRTAFLLGENCWKWRLESHIENKSFEKFDGLIDKIIQYLSVTDSKKSLVVNHESFYNQSDKIEITAQYFNKNYEFDEKARLTIAVINKTTNKSKTYDLLKDNNTFKANLNGLQAGKYTFSVKELNSNTVYNSNFEILDFDIEKQFTNPDLIKLSQVAVQTKGQLIFPNRIDDLIKILLNNESYKAVQKTVIKKSPLIDWLWLLLIILTSLSTEWLVRKFKGMV